METIQVKDKCFELYIPDGEIQRRVAEVAARIKADMAGERPLLVGILTGAYMFAADLSRALDGEYEMTFARYSSYVGTNSTGQLVEVMPIQADVKDRIVILVEDVIDSGLTMSLVRARCLELGAREVRLATMLFKPAALRADLTPDYVCFEIPNDFVVGHGLDYDEFGRVYKDIYRLKV